YIWQTAVLLCFTESPSEIKRDNNEMALHCSVAVSLALQPALADELFGNHPLTPQARDAFVTDLLKK
ncbi:hypothetical protein K27_06175, partial [Klebsiella pneumoniae]